LNDLTPDVVEEAEVKAIVPKVKKSKKKVIVE
jgi:hypothetical protein